MVVILLVVPSSSSLITSTTTTYTTTSPSLSLSPDANSKSPSTQSSFVYLNLPRISAASYYHYDRRNDYFRERQLSQPSISVQHTEKPLQKYLSNDLLYERPQRTHTQPQFQAAGGSTQPSRLSENSNRFNQQHSSGAKNSAFHIQRNEKVEKQNCHVVERSSKQPENQVSSRHPMGYTQQTILSAQQPNGCIKKPKETFKNSGYIQQPKEKLGCVQQPKPYFSRSRGNIQQSKEPTIFPHQIDPPLEFSNGYIPHSKVSPVEPLIKISHRNSDSNGQTPPSAQFSRQHFLQQLLEKTSSQNSRTVRFSPESLLQQPKIKHATAKLPPPDANYNKRNTKDYINHITRINISSDHSQIDENRNGEPEAITKEGRCTIDLFILLQKLKLIPELEKVALFVLIR